MAHTLISEGDGHGALTVWSLTLRKWTNLSSGSKLFVRMAVEYSYGVLPFDLDAALDSAAEMDDLQLCYFDEDHACERAVRVVPLTEAELVSGCDEFHMQLLEDLADRAIDEYDF